ncbi:hypothetical protein C0993_005512 [Termitomyces sp. T159_Od127]|nr:hypothetical protein C0993_005512 [Termitomyces sp. T159_Od127]
MPWKDQAPRFLQRHPNISVLECVKDGLPLVEFDEMNPPYKFSLPKLKKLVTETASTFHYLEGPCPLLRYARITWDDLTATDTILSFLSSSPALHHLDNIVSVQNTPSLSAIGEHAPGVINLTFRLETNGVQMTEEILEEFHDLLKEDIESFEKIVTLSVIPVDANHWKEYDLCTDEVNDDFDFVTCLGELCPRLCIVATYGGIIWERNRPSGYWLPLVYSKKDEWYKYTDKYDEAELVIVSSWEPSYRGERVLRTYVWDRCPPK